MRRNAKSARPASSRETNVRKYLKARRKELGLTQTQLAKRLRVDQSAISRLEGDPYFYPSSELATRLARALKLNEQAIQFWATEYRADEYPPKGKLDTERYYRFLLLSSLGDIGEAISDTLVTFLGERGVLNETHFAEHAVGLLKVMNLEDQIRRDIRVYSLGVRLVFEPEGVSNEEVYGSPFDQEGAFDRYLNEAAKALPPANPERLGAY